MVAIETIVVAIEMIAVVVIDTIAVAGRYVVMIEVDVDVFAPILCFHNASSSCIRISVPTRVL